MKKTFSLMIIRNTFSFIISIFLFFCIVVDQSYATPHHDWIGVPKSEYGEQLWDRKSIKRNDDGSVRILSKFIPQTKSEITKDIFYTMDINCFEKSFKDVYVSTDLINDRSNDETDWQDPNGDELILGVIGQVCNFEN